jgi:hypothetical protein
MIPNVFEGEYAAPRSVLFDLRKRAVGTHKKSLQNTEADLIGANIKYLMSLALHK